MEKLCNAITIHATSNHFRRLLNFFLFQVVFLLILPSTDLRGQATVYGRVIFIDSKPGEFQVSSTGSTPTICRLNNTKDAGIFKLFYPNKKPSDQIFIKINSKNFEYALNSLGKYTIPDGAKDSVILFVQRKKVENETDNLVTLAHMPAYNKILIANKKLENQLDSLSKVQYQTKDEFEQVLGRFNQIRDELLTNQEILRTYRQMFGEVSDYISTLDIGSYNQEFANGVSYYKKGEIEFAQVSFEKAAELTNGSKSLMILDKNDQQLRNQIIKNQTIRDSIIAFNKKAATSLYLASQMAMLRFNLEKSHSLLDSALILDSTNFLVCLKYIQLSQVTNRILDSNMFRLALGNASNRLDSVIIFNLLAENLLAQNELSRASSKAQTAYESLLSLKVQSKDLKHLISEINSLSILYRIRLQEKQFIEAENFKHLAFSSLAQYSMCCWVKLDGPQGLIPHYTLLSMYEHDLNIEKKALILFNSLKILERLNPDSFEYLNGAVIFASAARLSSDLGYSRVSISLFFKAFYCLNKLHDLKPLTYSYDLISHMIDMINFFHTERQFQLSLAMIEDVQQLLKRETSAGILDSIVYYDMNSSVLNLKGMVLSDLEKPKESIASLQEAIANRELLISLLPEDQHQEYLLGSLFHTIAQTYQESDTLNKAKSYYFRAIELRKGFYDYRSRLSIAQSYNNLGNTYSELGNLDSAEVCIKESVRIKDSLSQHAGSISHLQATLAAGYYSLSNINFQQGKFEDALKWAMRSYRIRKQFYQHSPERSAKELSLTTNALGNIHYVLGDTIKADLFFFETMTLKDLSRKQNPSEIFEYLNFLRNYGIFWDKVYQNKSFQGLDRRREIYDHLLMAAPEDLLQELKLEMNKK